MEHRKQVVELMKQELQQRKNGVTTYFSVMDDEDLENAIRRHEKKLHKAHPVYTLL